MLLGLAACGDVPQPFRPGDDAPASALVRPPSAARVVVTTRGLPPDLAPQSETLNEAVAEALRTADLPATARPQGRPDIQLLVRAIPEQPQSRIEISVTDAEGQAMASPPEPISVAHGDLVAADLAAQAGLAARIARIAVPLIRGAETSRRAQVVRQSIDPAAAGARVAVLGVTGAPGDGNAALARQMVDALRRKGVLVQDEPAGAHFLVRAEVRLAPAQSGSQPVEIVWRVSRGDGASAGEVAQNNTVPAGSLDRFWGDIAFAVAEAAVGGVVQVMERTQADLPDWMRRAHGAPVAVAGTMPGATPGAEDGRGGLPPMGQISDGRSGLMPRGMPGTGEDAQFGAQPPGMAQAAPGDISGGVPTPRWARAQGAAEASGEIETLVPSRVVPLGIAGAGGMPGMVAAPMQPVGAAQLPPGYAATQLPPGYAPTPSGVPQGYVVVYTNRGPMLVPGYLPPGFIAVPMPGAPAPINFQAAPQPGLPAGATSFPPGASLTGGPPSGEQAEPAIPAIDPATPFRAAAGAPGSGGSGPGGPGPGGSGASAALPDVATSGAALPGAASAGRQAASDAALAAGPAPTRADASAAPDAASGTAPGMAPGTTRAHPTTIHVDSRAAGARPAAALSHTLPAVARPSRASPSGTTPSGTEATGAEATAAGSIGAGPSDAESSGSGDPPGPAAARAPQHDPGSFRRRPPAGALANRPPTAEPTPVPPPPADNASLSGVAGAAVVPGPGPLLRAPSLAAPPRMNAGQPTARFGPGTGSRNAPGSGPDVGPAVEPAPVPRLASPRGTVGAADTGADQTRPDPRPR